MAGQLKNFTVKENQKTWDKYFKYQLEGFGGNQYEKKKVSVNQYKPIVLELDSYYNKPFSQVTGDEILQFMNVANQKRREAHLRGFFNTCASNGFLQLQKSTLAWIIPVEYRNIVKLIMGM